MNIDDTITALQQCAADYRVQALAWEAEGQIGGTAVATLREKATWLEHAIDLLDRLEGLDK